MHTGLAPGRPRLLYVAIVAFPSLWKVINSVCFGDNYLTSAAALLVHHLFICLRFTCLPIHVLSAPLFS